MELNPIPRELIAAPHDGPPEPLLGIWNKAEGQLLCDQALDEPFRIGKIFLPSAGATIRLRVREM
jgi:hypothetical protein